MTLELLIPLTTLLGFCIGAIIGLKFNSRPLPIGTRQPSPFASRTSFLFEGNDLIDATPSGYQLLEGLNYFESDKENLIALCRDQYPDLETAWNSITSLECLKLVDRETQACDLEIACTGHRVSLRLLDGPEYRGQTIQEDLLAKRLNDLAGILEKSPYLIWKEWPDGKLIWSNQRYSDFLAKQKDGEQIDTALTTDRLFPELTHPEKDQSTAQECHLCTIDHLAQEEHWFNVTSFPSNEGALHFAADANAAVKSDRLQKSMLRTFVQIFAQLAIGFAIFDENRQLKIYNPALSDHCGLDPVFLSSQPTLSRVIEEMRSKDKTPIPKDYGEFRQTIRDLENATSGSGYEAIWALSDGQNLRVTARPYQNGSMAFLVEDVSKEITLTRKYRSEVQAHQDMIDTIKEPMFLFSPSENLAAQNIAGTEFLGKKGILGCQTLREFSSIVATKMLRGRQSSNLSKFLAIARNQELLVHLVDGRTMSLNRTAVAGGYFLIKLVHIYAPVVKIPRVVERAAR